MIVGKTCKKTNSHLKGVVSSVSTRTLENIRNLRDSGKRDVDPVQKLAQLVRSVVLQTEKQMTQTQQVLDMGRRSLYQYRSQPSETPAAVRVLQREGLSEAKPPVAFSGTDSFRREVDQEGTLVGVESQGKGEGRLYVPPANGVRAQQAKQKRQTPRFQMEHCPDPKGCQYSHDGVAYEEIVRKVQKYVVDLKAKEQKPSTRLTEEVYEGLSTSGVLKSESTPREEVMSTMQATLSVMSEQLSPAYTLTDLRVEDGEAETEGRQY